MDHGMMRRRRSGRRRRRRIGRIEINFLTNDIV